MKSIAEKILNGGLISEEEAREIASHEDVLELFYHANRIRERFRGKAVDLCSIVSAKTGACPEDCSYCAQSKKANSKITTHALRDKGFILDKASSAKGQGAKRFCIVSSGRRVTQAELKSIAAMLPAIRDAGLLPCATLGLLGKEELLMLKEAGLERCHHNLETSRRFFPEICSTHSYDEKIKTIEAVKESGLSLCSGGIFGMGENNDDRIEMAFTLRELGADSIPINFLVPVKGTPLEDMDALPALEALRIIGLYRFILPDREIRVCGGRLQTLGEMNALVFTAGADGLLTGDCLTTQGGSPEDDLKLIRHLGLALA